MSSLAAPAVVAWLVLSQAPGPDAAEVAGHTEALRRLVPASMTLAYEAPFLVVGDEPPARVRERTRTVVRWAKELLLKDFFTELPSELHEVWLLGTPASYRRVSREQFNVDPDTPYGYYLPARRALVMNVGPGAGTLVHELVHPFMRQAWPEAPAWLNEGLASLFEFPVEQGGHLKGKVNWRLPGLKRGLQHHAVPPLSVLAHLGQDDFYRDPHGLHYAQARYVCYWLQEKGLLVRFVRLAIERQAEDPSGWSALQTVLGGDPDALRGEWERFVLGLGGRA